MQRQNKRRFYALVSTLVISFSFFSNVLHAQDHNRIERFFQDRMSARLVDGKTSQQLLPDELKKPLRKMFFQPDEIPLNQNFKNITGRLKDFGKLTTPRTYNDPIYTVDTAVVYGIVDSLRYSYSIDANGRYYSVVIEKRNNDQWVKYSRTTYTYDENGREISELLERRKNGQWENLIRYTIAYNTNGKFLSFLYEHWVSGQWENVYRFMNTYDVEGRELTNVFEVWGDGEWVFVSRFMYTYDENGNVEIELYENRVDEQILFSFRSNYTYDESGRIISKLDEELIGNLWMPTYRTTNAYNESGNRVLVAIEEWENEQWQNISRSVTTYTKSGKLLSYFSERWLNGKWENTFRFNDEYDGKNNLTFHFAEIWLQGSWGPANHFVSVDDSAGNYRTYIGSKIYLHYRKVTTTNASNDIELPSSFQLHQNYPNPFNPTTVIRYQLPEQSHVRLEIFNTLGQRVEELVNQVQDGNLHEVQWNAHMASGMYYYRLSAVATADTKKNFVQVRKMLLLK